MNEQQILNYLQNRLAAKKLKAAIKPEALKEKKAARNVACTFCRTIILQGAGYVSFRSQGGAIFKGKSLRTERMHSTCLNRYLRPGVVISAR